jgi:hypothetical protein
MGPRADLDDVENYKYLTLMVLELRPFCGRSYTDCATVALIETEVPSQRSTTCRKRKQISTINSYSMKTLILLRDEMDEKAKNIWVIFAFRFHKSPSQRAQMLVHSFAMMTKTYGRVKSTQL